MGDYYSIAYTKNGWIMHHGIKGMRWGFRRFQREDGSYTSAGKKRYDDGASPKHYDYKKSSKYKSANARQKAEMTNRYNYVAKFFGGKRAANKFTYNVNEKGADVTKELHKAQFEHMMKLAVASAAVATAVSVGKKAMQTERMNAMMGSSMAQAYGEMAGLQTYTKAPGLGLRAFANAAAVGGRLRNAAGV